MCWQTLADELRYKSAEGHRRAWQPDRSFSIFEKLVTSSEAAGDGSICDGCWRSLKTGQEKRSKYKTIQRRFFEPEKQSWTQDAKRLSTDQMESLILAQDERWRHA